MSANVYQAACAAAPVGMEVAAVAAADPQRMAITSEHGNRSYAELNARINQLCRCLREAGLEAGDPVALVCGNRPEFAETALASHRLGLRITPVNWHLSPEEVAYIVGNCEAKALIADIRSTEAALLAASEGQDLDLKLAVGGAIAGFADYEQSLAAQDASDVENTGRGTVMQYTSGTTGRPKGVLRKQPDPAAAAGMQELMTAFFQFDTESGKDKTLVTGPLYHAGPFNVCMLIPLNAGIGVVMMDKWEPEKTLQLIEEQQVTHSFFVPTMFSRMLALPEATRTAYKLDSLRWVMHGAAPCAMSVKQAMLDWWGPIIWEMFAGTEGPGTIVSPQDWLAKPGTVGKPGEGQMLILDEQHQPCEPGVEGQVWVQNPADSKFEYYKAPEKTAEAQQVEGYFSAGDIGYIDADGFLFLTGRSAETIISAGVNIYPQEIDDVLIKHPAVQDVACVGVPNVDLGEEVKAVVQLVEGASATADELIAHCDGSLAKQKWPRSVDFVDEIPRSEAGKVYRRALRDSYWQNQDSKL